MNGSWKTLYAGYFILASDVAGLVAKAIQEQGIPQDPTTWIMFVALLGAGISALLSKDYNVSNSPKPAAPTVVSEKDAVKPNPAAVPPVVPVVLICALLFGTVASCAGGPGVQMEPFTTDEVNVLVHAATATYLMERNIKPDVALNAAVYLETLRHTVTTGEVDLSSLRVQVVDKVPARWQPLAAATWVILLKRINLEQLIAEGKHAEARAYIDAALSGAASALKSRAGA